MPSQYVTLGRAQYGCTFDNKLYLIFNSKFIIYRSNYKNTVDYK